MTTTHDNTATTWRDLSDQLTPRQFDELSRHEARHPREVNYLLVEARSYIEQNLDDRLHFGGVEKPEGAAKVYLGEMRPDGRWFREFTGAVRAVAGVSVFLDGTQFEDGTIERDLTVGVNDLPSSTGGRLTAEQAREFAAALTEAADELEAAG